MPNSVVDKNAVLDEIRRVARTMGHAPSRTEFQARSQLREYHVLQHFSRWKEAIRAAGLEPDAANVRLEDGALLEDWGSMVRRLRQIPTRAYYRREGKYNPGLLEDHLGPWSGIPRQFREFATGKLAWQDVLALLPPEDAKSELELRPPASNGNTAQTLVPAHTPSVIQHPSLDSRPTYGNLIDFRGLRHEPVNKDGVVFLFGMAAKELGYLVEALQAGFPECEAKRQVSVGKWQRVRIEFEFESRDFRDHGHPFDGCEVIVCWRHNWLDCPSRLEVVELSTVIRSLAKSEDRS
jgi:Homing endonuclease associated repeat